MLQQVEITASAEDSGHRLDKFLSSRMEGFSRTRIAALISQGNLKIQDSIITDISLKVKEGQQFYLTIPPPEPSDIIPTEIPLHIIYEDEDLLVINKPTGLVVHPAAGHRDDTLVNALLYHCQGQLSGIGGVERPGIIHRLDKDTSGLLLVAKNDSTHASLSEQFSLHTVRKIYQALVYGVFREKQGALTGNIARSPHNRQKMALVKSGGKEALTLYKTIGTYLDGEFSLVECDLRTGRTHQIRVHLSQNGHSIIGDQVYGGVQKALRKSLPASVREALKGFKRQALHACRITFIHPHKGREMTFEAPLPEDMQALLALLSAQ